MKKNIAFISTMGGVAWGGSEYLWSATAEQALAKSHEVFISLYNWSVEHQLITNLQQQGAQLLPRPRFPKPLSLTSRITRRIYQYFSLQPPLPKSSYQPVFDSKPDVICISQGSSYEVAYIPDLVDLLHSYSIPYVVVCQLNFEPLSFDDTTRKTARQFFNKAAHIAFVSHQNLILAERQLAQSLPNAVVVQNPVNMYNLDIVPFPPQSTAFLACVARLDTFCKGQDVLFKVLSTPIWQERNWQCCLYGSGPDQTYLEALARHYDVAQKVKFMGHVNDVRSIWAENHLLVLPSRAEGTPLCLVEAMLCGRPAVVTDVGGNADWIEESHTGFIAEAATTKSFGAALERAWLARENWKQIGAKAHEYAAAKFDRSPGQSLLKLVLDAAKR